MVYINYNGISKRPNDEKLIESVVEKIFSEEKFLDSFEVYITLTNNDEIHKINKEYRDVDRATDVLSFPMYERDEIAKIKTSFYNKNINADADICDDYNIDDEVEKILGDIIISVEKVKKQAEEYGHSFERELAYMVTHGMLHLLGYDHIIDDEKKIMRKREEEILGVLNISR